MSIIIVSEPIIANSVSFFKGSTFIVNGTCSLFSTHLSVRSIDPTFFAEVTL